MLAMLTHAARALVAIAEIPRFAGSSTRPAGFEPATRGLEVRRSLPGFSYPILRRLSSPRRQLVGNNGRRFKNSLKRAAKQAGSSPVDLVASIRGGAPLLTQGGDWTPEMQQSRSGRLAGSPHGGAAVGRQCRKIVASQFRWAEVWPRVRATLESARPMRIRS